MAPKQSEQPKQNILVVEDQEEVAYAVGRALRPSYEVQFAKDVPEALEIMKSHLLDLVLLDIMLPGISGLWLCRYIKSDLVLRHTPIIFLTGMNSVDDMVNGLRSGADDYLQKPFKREELLARIEAIIRRNSSSLDANPLTRLPGNCFIENEILRRISSHSIFSVLYIDLNDFKAYNDFYGFHRGDHVLRKMAALLMTYEKKGTIGHLGGDDFVLILDDEDPAMICESIIRSFDAEALTFYDAKELQVKEIRTLDRHGQMRSFPLISVAIGVVTNKVRHVSSLGEVATIGAELKQYAKQHSGSYYAIDRRTTQRSLSSKEEPPKSNPSDNYF